MAARPRDLPETQTCSWCGYLALGHWHDGEMFVCSHCWEMHGGKMPDAIEEPESAPQPTPTADGPPDDAGAQGGAATGPGCRALYCLLAGWLLREASPPDSG